MDKILSLFRNRNFILLLGLCIGMLLPQSAHLSFHLTLPALALVMTLATMGVSGNIFRSPSALVIPALLGIIMNYLVLAGFILVMSMIIIREADLWTGFVILAGVPPAVAVIPFADFLKGSRTYALMGTVGAYLGALIIMPLMSFMLLGPGFYDPGKLLMIMAELIIAPLILSRILLRYGMDKRLASTKGTITNWSFFVLVYTIVGLNQDVLVNKPLKLVPIMAIAIGSTFFLGWFIERVGAFFRLDRKTVTSIVLLGTLKNYGLAGGIALALFGKQTAIPATVSTVFMIVYIIWLSFKKKRENL